jgi:2-oxoglutarate ferredoxin oxidoreductase subunit beta
MLPYYPLGVYRDVKAEGYANVAEAAAARAERLASGGDA